MRALTNLPRQWSMSELPGYRDAPNQSTYARFDGVLPQVPSDLDNLDWLRTEPDAEEWAIGPDNDQTETPLTSAELTRLLPGMRLPQALSVLAAEPELQAKLRSSTACYLDLGDAVVPVVGDEPGRLLHILSDQQWCLHWLLFLGDAGSQAVLETELPYGYELSIDEREQFGDLPALEVFDPADQHATVCAESFAEFLYRFWIENEIWFALMGPDDEPKEFDELPETQRRYLQWYVDHPQT